MIFLEKLKEKTIIFDGAIGTLLMAAGHASSKSPVLLNLEQPDLVTDIHRQYYDAGSDVVITNTFGGNPLKLAADSTRSLLAIKSKSNTSALAKVRKWNFLRSCLSPMAMMWL